MSRTKHHFLKLFRRILSGLLTGLVLFSLMGCHRAEPEMERPKVLRVLIEKNEKEDPSGLKYQLADAVQRFTEKHKGYRVELESLPKQGEGRTEMLQKIRAELMAGEGPDVLLLCNAYSDYDRLNPREPLLADVELAMRNGLFYDISKFYDGDTALKKEELQPVVMEAGVLDGERYVLPLRFDIPVMFVEKNRFAKIGLSTDFFEKNILDLIDYFVSTKDNAIAINFFPQDIQPQFTMNVFPQLFDYEEGTVTVTREEMETYLRAYQAYRLRHVQAVKSDPISEAVEVQQYFRYGKYWTKQTDNFMLIQSLEDALEIMAIGKMKEAELAAYPLRSMDGSVVADITFYGAVSAGSKNPELAYDFICYFLTEDFQWDRNATQIGNNWHVATYGWPVRVKGSFGEVAKSAHKASERKWVTQKYDLDFSVLTNEDLPVEDLPIDSARFSIALEQKFWLDLWTLQVYGVEGPPNVDISQLAEEWIEKLQVHIEEG